MTKGDIIGSVHEKRRKRRIYYFSVAGFLALDLLLAAAVWVFVASPLFRVGDINVAGNNSVSSESILDFLHAKIPGRNWFGNLLGFNNLLVWPKDVASVDMSLIPALDKIDIKKDYGSKNVSITVQEREPYATWCTMAASADSVMAPVDCFWFDLSGTAFKHTLASEGSLILVIHDYSGGKVGLGRGVLPNFQIPNLISILDVVKNSGVNVKEIRINDASLDELEVDTFGGPKIYFSLRFTADMAFPAIENFISKSNFKNLQYLDFRVENRVYYK